MLNGKCYGDTYAVGFTCFLDKQDSPFALDRKTAKLHGTKPKGSKSNGRHIVSVERVPSVLTKCLAVEHPSHTYLITESCIPTHNTSAAQALCEYFLLKWKRLYNYDARILIIRSNREAAKQVLGAIGANLGGNNPIITEAFGNLKSDDFVWNSESITLNWRSTNYREPSVATGGTESPQTGMHVDLVIADDLVNETNYNSERDMLRARMKLQTLDPILNRWGSLIQIGTRWSHNDSAAFVLDMNEALAEQGKEPEWKCLIRGVYLEDGSLYYPDHLSEKVIEQKRRSMESKLFTAFYLNQVIADDSKVFRPEYLRFYGGDSDYYPDDEEIASLEIKGGSLDGSKEAVRCTIHIDPANTFGADSNFTGIAVVLTTFDERYFLHETWKGKEAPSLIIARIVAMCNQYKPASLSIDVAGQQNLWLIPLKQELDKAGIRVTIDSYRGKTHDEKVGKGILGKAKRIEALEPLFREGRIYVRTGYNNALLHEYNFYDGPTHKNHFDLLDAVAHLRTMTRKPQPHIFKENLERLEMLELEDMENEKVPKKVAGTRTGY
jgi:phage terminase large subunit-like protein